MIKEVGKKVSTRPMVPPLMCVAVRSWDNDPTPVLNDCQHARMPILPGKVMFSVVSVHLTHGALSAPRLCIQTSSDLKNPILQKLFRTEDLSQSPSQSLSIIYCQVRGCLKGFSFLLCHAKRTRSMKPATLKCNSLRATNI